MDKCVTEFSNFKLAAMFVYKSLITTSSFDKFASSGGNLLHRINIVINSWTRFQSFPCKQTLIFISNSHTSSWHNAVYEHHHIRENSLEQKLSSKKPQASWSKPLKTPLPFQIRRPERWKNGMNTSYRSYLTRSHDSHLHFEMLRHFTLLAGV